MKIFALTISADKLIFVSMFMRKISLFFFLLFINSCSDLRKTGLTGLIYGTTYNIQFYSSSYEDYSAEIDSIFNEIDNSMSTYKTNSLISKINRNESSFIDNHFINVFKVSKEIYKNTNGRFDPSIGLIVNYWGFGPEKNDSQDEQLNNLLSKVGFDKSKGLVSENCLIE